MAPSRSFSSRLVSGFALVLIGLVLACGVGEAMVRLATANQKNYLIEMWRYATLLKRGSADPMVGHEHVPGASARLQGVDVSINSLGMRGPEPDLTSPSKRRIVILGDSIAFGWGVPEADTLRGQLAQRLGPSTEVMTTGVGNMNMSQIVAHWLHYSNKVRAHTVIVLSTARAPIVMPTDRPGWLVRNSELYALIVSFAEMMGKGNPTPENLVQGYKDIWSGGPGRTGMDAALTRLAQDQRNRGYRIIVVQIPEMHSFHPYLFGFTSQIMRGECRSRGWDFVDPLSKLQVQPAKSYWAAADDVHPNRQAFGILADVLVPMLSDPHA